MEKCCHVEYKRLKKVLKSCRRYRDINNTLDSNGDQENAVTRYCNYNSCPSVMVEVQGQKMNNIEENVVGAGVYVSGATKELDQASRLKKRRTWACWIGIVVLVFLLECLVAVWF